MHRLLIILGLSFALASCGGDDAEDGDSSSRYLAPSSSNVVTASGWPAPAGGAVWPVGRVRIRPSR